MKIVSFYPNFFLLLRRCLLDGQKCGSSFTIPRYAGRFCDGIPECPTESNYVTPKMFGYAADECGDGCLNSSKNKKLRDCSIYPDILPDPGSYSGLITGQSTLFNDCKYEVRL